jgi:hypothetical protein
MGQPWDIHRTSIGEGFKKSAFLSEFSYTGFSDYPKITIHTFFNTPEITIHFCRVSYIIILGGFVFYVWKPLRLKYYRQEGG